MWVKEKGKILGEGQRGILRLYIYKKRDEVKGGAEKSNVNKQYEKCQEYQKNVLHIACYNEKGKMIINMSEGKRQDMKQMKQWTENRAAKKYNQTRKI